ncbi:MAG: hypothetical protein JXR37_13590 [Kiritimatiellae bacterium]|nr:hypothetical protein [Kiritimatiellia bacterium]
MPWIVRDLARSAGRDLDVRMVTSGGKTLEWHGYNRESVEAIAQKDWAFVVLQELSTGPLEAPESMRQAALA